MDVDAVVGGCEDQPRIAHPELASASGPVGRAKMSFMLRPYAARSNYEKRPECMLDNLAKPLTVGHLAERVRMSRRTLIRRFHEETGAPLMTWYRRGFRNQVVEHGAGLGVRVG
ncbi:hypothetical protein ACFRKB_20890 [Streptomyces scopuliridis]|uniref:hypothetical protein n=1 Tax=Streptomyces scopuliridis TaxID=452529 RepID=UPI0036A64223